MLLFKNKKKFDQPLIYPSDRFIKFIIYTANDNITYLMDWFTLK